jgi:hypothetical protein
MFPIHRIDRSTSEAVEPLGTKPKFWFTANGRRMLFKAEERGTGEDWAEKIACHLCELLGLPHVHYELAEEYEGSQYIRPGVICETCAPPPLSLVLGNQLLLERDPNYPTEEGRKYKVRGHTVGAVAGILADLGPPLPDVAAGFPDDVRTALDVFIGYVLLDAWIANPDRHHQNWAALRDDVLRLAPTFDHGASLARGITDEERKGRLETADRNFSVAYFAQKARSAFYADSSDLSVLLTCDAYRTFAKLSPRAAEGWLIRLALVNRSRIVQILDEVPNRRMSSISKDFTLALLEENKRRLTEGQGV